MCLCYCSIPVGFREPQDEGNVSDGGWPDHSSSLINICIPPPIRVSHLLTFVLGYHTQTTTFQLHFPAGSKRVQSLSYLENVFLSFTIKLIQRSTAHSDTRRRTPTNLYPKDHTGAGILAAPAPLVTPIPVQAPYLITSHHARSLHI